MRHRSSIAVVLAAVAAGSGCGSSGSSSESSGSTTAAAPKGSGCEQVAAPKPKHVKLKAPPQTVKRGEKLSAVVETSCGRFEIALDTQQQPKTVNSFVYLAKRGFYDGLDFQRVVPRFVVQGGDPLGTGAGGPGYTVVEAPPANAVYRRGVVAMAKTQLQPPGASGSQFFVVTAPADAGLPADYAVLGRVTSGMQSVERIGRLADPKLGPQGGEPIEPVIIRRITVG
jgi:cyclophilin family peptidyl-prolyl cis-trans isomerase